jgi:hypothetical protein
MAKRLDAHSIDGRHGVHIPFGARQPGPSQVGAATPGQRSWKCENRRDNITAMATPEDWTIVKDALSPLCEPLYRCADRSQELADDHFILHGMEHEEHPGGRAHLARHHLRSELKKELKKEKKLGGWLVSRPRPNGEVTLTLGTMTLRMLRPGPTVVETFPAPPPGRNRARVYYYRNPELTLFGPAGSKLIGIWAFDPEVEEVAIRVVRPVREWRFGQYEQVDINFWLPRLSEDMAKLEFVPSDEGIVLPLPDELEEGDEGADGTDG